MTDTIRTIAGGGTAGLLVALCIAIAWLVLDRRRGEALIETLRAEIKELHVKSLASAQTERDQRLADAKSAYEDLAEKHASLIEIVHRNTTELEARAERDREVKEAIQSLEEAVREGPNRRK